MFASYSAKALSAVLDCFHIPIFVVERPAPDAQFHLLCINSSFSDATGLDVTSLHHKKWRDFLPTEEARVLEERCAFCADTQTDLRCSAGLNRHPEQTRRDVWLQHIPLPDGGDRVMGIRLSQQPGAHTDKYQIVFEDIRFFSSLADLQLQNLVSMFEASRQSDLFCEDNTGRIDRLIGICRGVQKAVEDIRETLKRAGQDRTRPSETSIVPAHRPSLPIGDETTPRMVRALPDTTRPGEEDESNSA